MLLPIRAVAERYSVCVRTIERWADTPALGFPPIVTINTRRYVNVDALNAWDQRNSRAAAERQAGELQTAVTT
jgi:hypothetical protein